MDLHPAFGIADTHSIRQELQAMGTELYRVVCCHRSQVLEAEDVVGTYILGERTIHRARNSCWNGKSCVVPWEECRKEGDCLVQRRRVRKTKLGHQAILQTAKEAFDASFGLR